MEKPTSQWTDNYNTKRQNSDVICHYIQLTDCYKSVEIPVPL